MKNWVFIPITIVLCLLVSSSVWARGGGGCLAKGTPVMTPSGPVAIEKLGINGPVLSLTGGKLQRAAVKARTEVRPDDYVEITAGKHKILMTSEHPVMAGPGVYRVARFLKAGENVYQVLDGKLHAVAVDSVRRVASGEPAYNLLVMPGGTFIGDGIVVHNKGCFLPDSEIMKSDGTKKMIGKVRRGDELLAYSPEGNVVYTKVREIIRHTVDEYIVVKTAHVTLRATAEHPFYTGNGTFKTLEVLKPGDTIFAWDGQTLSGQQIFSIQKVRERVRVFNLQTDHPNTFFASGIAVHNKGGGGGCFPGGTMIRTPQGRIPIGKLAANDTVQAINREGQIVNARVGKVFTSLGNVLSVITSRGVLLTTAEHPVGLADGTYLEAGLLRPGQSVLFREGDVLVTAAVLSTRLNGEKEPVYNLSVNMPHTFLADDFVVHNKGGGGGHSRSRSSGSGGGSSGGDPAVFSFLL